MLLAARRSSRTSCISSHIVFTHRTISFDSSSLSTRENVAPAFARPDKKTPLISLAPFDKQWPGWNLVIGIEAHAQLKTRRKLFSRTLVPEHRETDPNERVSLFDASFPGTLPVINPNCVRLATRTALALHAEIQPRSAFDRKHYFYGDLPAGYQITQNYAPFARNGYLKLHTQQKRIRIKQIQLEQDTAKSTTDSRRTFYDLNRAGMPLLEIVSHPDIRTLEEAGDYVKTLQAVLQSIGVSDGMMEAGSLRCDVNVSVHRTGEPFGVRTEVKNLNSIKSVMLAIHAEATRQIKLLTSDNGNRLVTQQTLAFDEDTCLTLPLRSKEGVEDYRYMPDPNLAISWVDSASIEKIKREMHDLGMTGPGDSVQELEYGCDGIRRRLAGLLGLSGADANPHLEGIESEGKIKESYKRDLDVLMSLDAGKTVGWDGAMAPGAVTFFEKVVGVESAGGFSGKKPRRDPKVVLNWVIHELLGQLAFRHQNFADNPISAQQLGDIIDAVEQGVITRTGGKTLLRHILDSAISIPKQIPSAVPEDAIKRDASCLPEKSSSTGRLSIAALIRKLNLAKSSSDSELERWCLQAIDELPIEAKKVRLGKKNVLMRLVGKVMKLSGGSADAILARELLERILTDPGVQDKSKR